MNRANFNWPTGIFVISYHLMLLIVWPFYFYYTPPSAAMWATSIFLFFATGMSITGGYHRYYSHLAYKAHPMVERVLLFFATMSAQGSALRWSYEHRNHHAYVDTDRDPYSIKKGFWFAHILWLFWKPKPIENKVVADLLKNPRLVFQHTYYPYLMFGTNIVVTAFVGWLLDDYLGAFVLSWWSRLFFLHHCTWFINSLAHTWGVRPFSQEESAVDNYCISLLTFGEGYHNYHHTFANDYRNGTRWFHFDPTKWMIWSLNKLGLAHNLKQVNKYHVKERLIADHKQELMELLKQSTISQKEELCETVSKASEQVSAKISQVRDLSAQYALVKEKGSATKTELKQQQLELKTLQKSCNHDWKQFERLYDKIMDQVKLSGVVPSRSH